MGSMTSISGMGEATPIVADRAQMPPEWQQEFDDTACRQDQLIREWLRVTSNSDDKSRHFLQHTRWILRDAVEMYWQASMRTWVNHFMMCTQSNDEAVAIQLIQQHNGNVDQAILTWQRETAHAGPHVITGEYLNT